MFSQLEEGELHLELVRINHLNSLAIVHSKTFLKPLQRPKFHQNIRLSNWDLIEWSKYLKIPIRDVLPRDRQVPHDHKQELLIYNLEPCYMSGSNWVATNVQDRVINYFDSFGMPQFQELVDHVKQKNMTL